MADRELTDAEAQALGLHERELTDEEAAGLGLPGHASPEMQAYLAAKAKGDAAAAPSTAGQPPGFLETFINSSNDKTPLGRQLKDTLAAMALRTGKAFGAGDSSVQLTPQAAAEAQARGIPNSVPNQANPLPDFGDAYRGARDTSSQRSAAGAAAHPWASGLGGATGTILSLLAPLPKATVGAGASGRILSNALTAGGYGVLNGAANSRGDLTKGEIGQVGSDALGIEGLQKAWQDAKDGHPGRAALDVMGAGGIGGGLAGGALGAVVEGGRAIASPLANALKGMAIDTGRKVLTNGADSLSKRAPVRASAVEEAMRSGAMPAFSNTKSVLGRLNGLTEEVGDQYGQLVSGLEAKGVQGPEARRVADSMLAQGAEAQLNTGANKAVPNSYLAEAENAEGVAAGQQRLGLTQSENIKRALQREAKYGRVEDTALNEAKANQASIYRQANEDAIDEAAKAAPADQELQALAQGFVPVKQRLGNLLEAEGAATRGAARVAQRSHFGLQDTLHAGAALASGHPGMALPVALISSFAKNRLPSALARGELSLSDFLRGAPSATPAAGYGMEELVNALRQPPNMSPALADTQDQAKQRMLADIIRQGGEAAR